MFVCLFFCSEAKTRKTVTYNYATMLVLLVVQTSNDLRMMEQYAAPLLSIAKADDTNAKLQGTYQYNKDQGAYAVCFELHCDFPLYFRTWQMAGGSGKTSI